MRIKSSDYTSNAGQGCALDPIYGETLYAE